MNVIIGVIPINGFWASAQDVVGRRSSRLSKVRAARSFVCSGGRPRSFSTSRACSIRSDMRSLTERANVLDDEPVNLLLQEDRRSSRISKGAQFSKRGILHIA